MTTVTYNSDTFFPLDTTLKPANWRKRYWHKPVSLGKVPCRLSMGEQESLYCHWLAEQRGWEVEDARKYAIGQSRAQLISANFAPDDELPITPRKPAKKIDHAAIAAAVATLSRLRATFGEAFPEEFPADIEKTIAALQIAA